MANQIAHTIPRWEHRGRGIQRTGSVEREAKHHNIPAKTHFVRRKLRGGRASEFCSRPENWDPYSRAFFMLPLHIFLLVPRLLPGNALHSRLRLVGSGDVCILFSVKSGERVANCSGGRSLQDISFPGRSLGTRM